VAVADVGVAMGPRNTRRLKTSAISAAVVAAVFVAALWDSGGGPFAHSSRNSDSTLARSGVITLIPQQEGLAFGMTKRQISRRLGQPEKIAGQCWQYGENKKNFVGGTINAVRLCFFAGQYQEWFVQTNGIWREHFDQSKKVVPPTDINPSPTGG
jgi:hypothetical protein